MIGHGGARWRGRRGGKGGERCRGCGCGEEEGREVCHGGLLGERGPLLVRGCSSVRDCCIRKKGKRRERKRKERKREKEKERKNRKFAGNFREEK
jgi:hypothetical protein